MKAQLALTLFMNLMGFLNVSLAGYFVHEYNISKFWKPFLWVSPIHLSWSVLALNEFGQNYRYQTYMIITLEGVGLWGDNKILMEPIAMFLVLAGVALGFRYLTMFTFTFRKLH